MKFEHLFYDIFNDAGILSDGSYKTEDGSQQIDGAIEVRNKIFIVETKWESTATLATSKLIAFSSKVNSKFDGTAGLFISFNELSEKTIGSARSGIKQNCIVIHGEDNILPIIAGEVSAAEYIWFCYKQASARGAVATSIAKFRKTAQKHPVDDKWDEIYRAFLAERDAATFAMLLDENYGRIDRLPEKTIILYPSHKTNPKVRANLDYLIDSICSDEQDMARFYEALTEKLTKTHWLKYADDYILNKARGLSELTPRKAAKIADNAMQYLREKEGNYDEENKASYVLDFVYEFLSDRYKVKLACAYANIYCDRFRRDHYPQKQIARKIFSKIDAEKRWDAIVNEVAARVAKYKADNFDDKTSALDYVKGRIKRDFERIIAEAMPINLNRQIERLYNQS